MKLIQIKKQRNFRQKIMQKIALPKIKIIQLTQIE